MRRDTEARCARRRRPLAALVLLLWCAAAAAQVGQLPQPLPGAVADAAGEAFAGAPAPAYVGGSDAFDFPRDPAVTRRVQQQLVAAAARENPAVRDELDRIVSSGAVLREFDKLLSRHGHSPRNLVDVMAAYFLIAWEVVNDRDSNDNPIGQAAVRRQLLGTMSGNPLVDLDPQARQEMGETLALSAMIAGSVFHELKRRGETVQVRQLQDGVHRVVLEQTGIDLRRMALTDGGLVATGSGAARIPAPPR